MQTKKLIFLGAKNIGYKCLKWLLDDVSNEVEIIAVFFNPKFENEPNSVGSLAMEYKIAMHTELNDIFKYSKVDIILSIQYHLILKKHHLQIADKAYNLHMAPLPELRGCNQFTIAIQKGMSNFGTTLHAMTEEIDQGEIILESRFQIDASSIWVEELIELTSNESYSLFTQYFRKVISHPEFRKTEEDYNERSTSMNYRKDIINLKKLEINPKSKEGKIIRSTHNRKFDPLVMIVGNRTFKLIEITK